MKRVFLLRHAKSDWESGARTDHDRPLSSRGREAARSMGRYMVREGLIPELVVCSSSVRTTETWRRLARRTLLEDVPLRIERRLYEADPSTVLEVIAGTPDSIGTLLVVGHEPAMSSVLAHLVAQSPGRYPTGTLAVVDFVVAPTWDACLESAGRLQRFVSPRSIPPEV